MRIGLYRGMPVFAGGAFQYEVTLLDALSELAPRQTDELVCLTSSDDSLRSLASTEKIAYGNLPVRLVGDGAFRQGPLESYLARPLPSAPPVPVTIPYDHGMERGFRSLGIDWLFQMLPSLVGVSARLPFVMPIHDLQHRLQPEFPEVSANGEAAQRDFLYETACRYATMIVVESEQGKQDLLTHYGHLIGEDRLRILPLFPPRLRAETVSAHELAAVAGRYGLPPRFFFYPAQFWQHKNHALIVEALARIKAERGVRIPVVFSGTYACAHRARTFQRVMEQADALGVAEQVLYVGYVPHEDMPALYRLSAGLVMPTFFGPSNIPAMEAWAYGRAVITSDIPGLREQTGDAGLLVDPRSSAALAEAMLALWNDEDLCRRLAARGQERLAEQDWEDFKCQVAAILEETSARVRTGNHPSPPLPEQAAAGRKGDR